MKKMFLIICLLALHPTTALANDLWHGWFRNDILRETAYVAIRTVEWGQTRYISDHPESLREVNPLLGDHPSHSRVDAQYALTVLGHVAVAHVLGPTKWRRYWQYLFIGVSSACVANNISVGARVRW